MKTMEKIKSMLMALMCAVALFGLSGCSDDDDEPAQTGNEVAGYKFVLTLSHQEKSDHADIVQTVCSFVDPDGKTKKLEYQEKTSDRGRIESELYTTLPGTLSVSVTETLLPDLKLDKEVYNTGLNMSFKLIIVGTDGKEISGDSDMNMGNTPVKADRLKDYYPRTKTFSYSIGKDGKFQKK